MRACVINYSPEDFEKMKNEIIEKVKALEYGDNNHILFITGTHLPDGDLIKTQSVFASCSDFAYGVCDLVFNHFRKKEK